jgi:hypothetical protein
MTETQDYSKVEPVQVHVTSATPGVMSGKVRRIVTIYKTLVLTADNPYDQVVNENVDRYCWTLLGGQQAATAAANDLVVGANQGDVQGLSGKAEALILPGAFIPAKIIGVSPVVFHGSNAAWVAALGVSPTYPMYLGIADHVYAD